MPAYHHPNPFDLLFYAGDLARARLGLPQTNIQLIIELEGGLDVDGFCRALAALHRVYPATNGRLTHHPLIGHPRWQLPKPQPAGNETEAANLKSQISNPRSEISDFQSRISSPVALRIHDAATLTGMTNDATAANDTPTHESPQRAAVHRASELLTTAPLDYVNSPPLQFDLFQNLPAGNVLCMRWPHAFMDARGGALVLEELQRFYEEQPDLAALQPSPDESRDDLPRLLGKLTAWQRTRLALKKPGRPPPADWSDIQLPTGPLLPADLELRYVMRSLPGDDMRRIADNAMRICGFARVGDYLRACAIRALHEMMPRPLAPGAGYSTNQLADNRKRRSRHPICHNLFYAMPIHIPQSVASDIKAAADIISNNTAEMRATGYVAHWWARLERLAQLPPAILAAILKASLKPDRSGHPRGGLGNTPSLPMGFMGSFSREMSNFCGTGLHGVSGVGGILPHEGFAINLNTPNDRLFITGAYYHPRVTRVQIETLLDHFTTYLLNPPK